jgi:septal ring factor EnvC (AmiA/AmiB activator)
MTNKLFVVLALSCLIGIPAAHAGCGSCCSSMSEAVQQKHANKELKRLTKKLSLTADQQTQVSAALKDKWEKMAAADKEASEKQEAIDKDADGKIEAALTPDQKARYDKMDAGRSCDVK